MSIKTKPVSYTSVYGEISCLMVAHQPIIWVTTSEENRFLVELNERCTKKLQKEIFVWSSYSGLQNYDVSLQGKKASDDSWKPDILLSRIASEVLSKDSYGRVYVLKDFHVYLNPQVQRQLRDIYELLKGTDKTILIVSPSVMYGNTSGLPPTLETQIAVVNYKLPNREDLKQLTKEILEKNKSPGIKIKYTEEELDNIAIALQGLSLEEAERAIFTSLVWLQEINIDKLIMEKECIIRKSDILEFIQTAPSIEQVGGLDDAKKYLQMYRRAYTKEAQAFGVEPLRGVLFLGIPGCGKSLLAKAIASEWKLPILRCDIGKVMSGIVGSSENRMRQMIGQAESIAPCILWVDEVEKALSGTKSSNMSDGGTMARVFGTLLQAMQEGMDGVTVLATANDISQLPPEFIRRFNEVFFVDLPTYEERVEIVNIHLKIRNRDSKKFNIVKIAEAAEGYTGAEIEKAIKDAITNAFYKDEVDVSDALILEALKSTKPISIMMGEQIKILREWAEGRARCASKPATIEKSTNKRKEIGLINI